MPSHTTCHCHGRTIKHCENYGKDNEKFTCDQARLDKLNDKTKG